MIRRFIAYYKPVRKLLFVDMLSAILIAGIDLITPRFTSHMIDVIIPSMNVTLVLRWSFYLLIAYAIRVSLQYVVEYWGHILGVRMEFAMRKQLFAHIQQLPIRFFDNIKVGKLMSRLVNDLNDISEVAHHGPEDLLISVVLLVGSFTMMYLTQWKLALILTVLVPLMIAVGISKNLKFRKAFRELRRRVADINAQAEDNFSGIRVVKAFTAESQQEQLFDDGNQRFATSRISALKTMAEFGVSVSFLSISFNWSFSLWEPGSLFPIRCPLADLSSFYCMCSSFSNPLTASQDSSCNTIRQWLDLNVFWKWSIHRHSQMRAIKSMI